MRGVEACDHDITTAAGLGRAAELDAADLEVVPVLILRDGEREVARWVGIMPPVADLRRAIAAQQETRCPA